MTELLKIEHLTTRFPIDDREAQVVEDLNLTINSGETLALVGESGCGKSMTALSIMGMVPHPGRIVDGKVWWNHNGSMIDLVHISPAELRKIRGQGIAMIFQEPMTALNPVMRIGQQISEMLEIHRPIPPERYHERIIELLELVGIPEPRTRYFSYPHELSGGMRQRVMIAIAIACNPHLLIADEPTTALDLTIQAQILHLLQQLRHKTGMSMLLITHDLSIVEYGSLAQVFSNPLHPYTRGLLKSMPDFSGSGTRAPLETIPGQVPDLSRLPSGCTYHDRCPLAQPVCKEKMPALTTGVDNQAARCWVTMGDK